MYIMAASATAAAAGGARSEAAIESSLLSTKSVAVLGLAFHHATEPYLVASLINGVVQVWNYETHQLVMRVVHHPFLAVRGVGMICDQSVGLVVTGQWRRRLQTQVLELRNGPMSLHSFGSLGLDPDCPIPS